ncbi:MAG TPA: dihydropteroate synthase [Acidobacteriota bacterium]|nr:dihydropteroate synthase [Acidobacteriota bacterium]
MLIIGERINSTRKRIGEAVQKGDADFIRAEARRQLDAGAGVLDINGGIPGREAELLAWLVKVVQEVQEAPLCLDSADPEALRRALPLCRQRPMINSITDEQERWGKVTPLVKEFQTKIIALCMSESGPPKGSADRVATACRLVDRLTSQGVALDDIYVDPCVFPVSTGPEHGPALLDAVGQIRSRYPGVHISAGVSNVSFGMPVRKLLNESLLVLLIGCGLDTAIIDPCTEGTVARILAAEALIGRDEYCTNYLRAYREGKLEPRPVAT